MKDIDGILSWMNDPSVRRFFRFEEEKTSPETVTAFINNAQDTEKNMHLAIVDETDEYMGTISLKSIDHLSRNAEYAISTCPHIHGKGIAFEATKEILNIAFNQLNLHRVYLNVLEENERANKFYLKFGFVYEGQFRDHINIRGELKSLNWYSLLATEFSK